VALVSQTERRNPAPESDASQRSLQDRSEARRRRPFQKARIIAENTSHPFPPPPTRSPVPPFSAVQIREIGSVWPILSLCVLCSASQKNPTGLRGCFERRSNRCHPELVEGPLILGAARWRAAANASLRRKAAIRPLVAALPRCASAFHIKPSTAPKLVWWRLRRVSSVSLW
jgi:hypothetical protein